MTLRHTRLLLGAAVITAALSLTSALHGSGYTERDEAMGVVGDANKRIAITFDDGPHPIYTPEILDILAEYDVKATFFVVGENVRKNPELIERELEEGHEVGNHTYTHPCALAKLSCAKLMDEISECEDAIFETVDFRPLSTTRRSKHLRCQTRLLRAWLHRGAVECRYNGLER